MVEPIDKKTILVVDDEPSILRVVAKILKMKNFDVLTAPDAGTAITIFKANQVDLVITDIYMPGSSGLDLLSVVRKYNKRMPIIIMSGKPSVDIAVECMKLGAVDYITKPLSIAILENSVDALFAVYDTTDSSLDELHNYKYKKFPIGYRIIDKIGEGATSVVYKVKKLYSKDSKNFALKMYRPELFENEDQLEKINTRFLHEVTAISRIDHPNIVRVIEFGMGTDKFSNYLLLEYVNGKSLFSLLAEGLISKYEDKLTILFQICEGLRVIHKANLVHRDIKPGNLLVSDDLRLKISDFGIVKFPHSGITGKRNIVGTPLYMAPETISQNPVDHRMDFFSLGITVYQLFTGTNPFKADSVQQMMDAIQYQDPLPPREIDPELPEELENIILRLLEKAPEDRYQDAEEICNELRLMPSDKLSEQQNETVS